MNLDTRLFDPADAASFPETNALLFIGGRWMEADGNAVFTRHNPVDPAFYSTAASASASDAVAAVQAAAAALPEWAATGPGRRRELLNRAADLLESRVDDFQKAMLIETSATQFWVKRNIAQAAMTLREAAAMTTQINGEVMASDMPGNVAMAVRQPVGVVLGIAPWNAPITLGVRAIAMPLACGNTVVLKGSEYCPRTHALIVEVLQQAGFPNGVVNFVVHNAKDAGAVVEATIAHKAVRRVNFTGSTRVGRIIAHLCAQHLKPALLELGGKAPLVVLDDADLHAAVDAAVFGAFGNSGQICMSTERLIVAEAIADEFVERLARRVTGLTIGDPAQGVFILGPVGDLQAVNRCNLLIEDALSKGARMVCGGRAIGALIPATLLDHVTPEMDIYHEETFGPVKAIIRVRDDEQAVETANDSEFGLSAAVFSGDIGRAWQVAGRIQSGICHINGPTVHDEPQMPFGGVKASGYGRFGGKSGMDAFTELRWISLQTKPRRYPF